MMVGAVDQDAANAHLVAHFAERDFQGSRCHQNVPGFAARINVLDWYPSMRAIATPRRPKATMP
jgi:hypothetical protein